MNFKIHETNDKIIELLYVYVLSYLLSFNGIFFNVRARCFRNTYISFIVMDHEVMREENRSGYFVVRYIPFLWRGVSESALKLRQLVDLL